jgi:NitT/TauT family transport system permease protein
MRLALTLLSFLLPLGVWCGVSYIPFLWHPKVLVSDPGDLDYASAGTLIDRTVFDDEVLRLRAEGKREPSGTRANPIFLPAPHQVARALVTAFRTPPRRASEPWFHQTLWHSVTIIFWGFLIASLIGVPLGILCGSYAWFARLLEPFVEFTRYMPAPVFGALCVAILGIHDAPKIAIIVIGTLFQQVLVIANTTRQLDPALLEAAQTLGAKRLSLLTRVVIPASITGIYTDMRILLGWAWTYLIVAELIGVSSGITYFINQQAKYRAYERVFASIILIGLIGLATDLVLASLGRQLFPWMRTARRGWFSALVGLVRGRGKAPVPVPGVDPEAPLADGLLDALDTPAVHHTHLAELRFAGISRVSSQVRQRRIVAGSGLSPLDSARCVTAKVGTAGVGCSGRRMPTNQDH